jgi:ribosome maturation factor RimP
MSLFYKNMTFKEKINLLLTEVLVEKPSLFDDLCITDAFKVIITLDDDNGVVLQTVLISVVRGLDREKSKIILCLSRGFFTIKEDQTIQEKIGRTLIVKTNTENIEAELVEANDDFVILSKQENLKR